MLLVSFLATGDVCSFSDASFTSFPEQYKSVSSAYKFTPQGYTWLLTSFTKIENNIGPKTEPWGTPIPIEDLEDISLLHTTYSDLLLRYDENHRASVSFIPYLDSLCSNTLWSIVSKHFRIFKEHTAVSVHGKKKYAAGHMDHLLRKAVGPQQKLPVHSID